jgi:hypothetical protein
MSTTMMPTKRLSSSPLLRKLFPSAFGCGDGVCTFTFDGQQYIPVSDTCGGDCHCPPPPGSLRELLHLEGHLKNLDELCLPCCSFTANPLEEAIRIHIELLKKHKVLVWTAGGLGILSAALLAAWAYRRMR